MENQLISVIIPTFNRSEFLEETVLSIVKQTFRPIELIVIDDGSVDDTKNKISQLKKHYEDNKFHIIYQYQNNKGANFARNAGFDLAKGNWIQFLDSDDTLEKNKFDLQVKSLLKTNSEVAVSDYKKISKYKTVLNKNNGNLIWRLSCGHSVHISTVLFKKEFLKDIKWNINLYREQDKEFVYKAILQSRKYVYVNQYLSNYRIHDKSQISKIYSKTPLQTIENIKSDLLLLFSKKKLRRFSIFYIIIHICYLVYKNLKRTFKYIIFGKYAFKFRD